MLQTTCALGLDNEITDDQQVGFALAPRAPGDNIEFQKERIERLKQQATTKNAWRCRLVRILELLWPVLCAYFLVEASQFCFLLKELFWRNSSVTAAFVFTRCVAA